MQKYFNNVTNRGGAALPSASVLVKTLAGATATIYSDNGTTPAANPIACDGNGYFEFYAADGHYSLTISGIGIVTQHIDDISLEDPDDFRARWYGPLAADPTLNPLGAAITPGDAYFNTVNKVLMIYGGTSWQVADANAASASAAATSAAQTQSLFNRIYLGGF